MTLQKEEAVAVREMGQRPDTVLSSICLPVNGGMYNAIHSAQIECSAISEDGARFIAADQHGYLHVGSIPKILGERQMCLDFEPRSFASVMGRLFASEYQGPTIEPQLQHYRGWRSWKCVTLRNNPKLRFAAMDSDGKVEIWKFHLCAWVQERVRQPYLCSVSTNGREFLEWESSECLYMKDYYGKVYRFTQEGMFRKAWRQVPNM